MTIDTLDDRRWKPRYLLPEVVFKVGSQRVRASNISQVGALIVWSSDTQIGEEILLNLKCDAHQEISLRAEVTRISPPCVGIQFRDPLPESFLNKFCDPVAVGESLQQLQPGWWHGPNADIVVHYFNNGNLQSVQVIFGAHFVEWTEGEGFITGTIETVMPAHSDQEQVQIHPDPKPDEIRLDAARELLSAVQDMDPLVRVRFAG